MDDNIIISKLGFNLLSSLLNFKALVPDPNTPGHPVYVDELSEKVKFVFSPPNTTPVICPMDCRNPRTYFQYLHGLLYKILIHFGSFF